MSGLMPPGPLAYEGQVVVPYIVRQFPPTSKDFNFNVPTIWIYPNEESAWILTGKPQNVANWLLFVSGGGNVGYLQGNTGGPVGPTVLGVINVVGDGTTIEISGNPGDNTLTASFIGSTGTEEFLADSGSATPAAGVITLSGGTTGLTTIGSGSTINLTGMLNVAHGGTGDGSFTAYMPITGGTTTTGALQSVSNAGAVAGYILTYTSSSSLPTWQANSASGDLSTLTDDVGTTITPSANNIQLVGHVVEQGATKFSTVVAGTHLANINPMSPARWIVDPLGFNGTHTTISSAISSATAGDTIFILPGTYTENPTLKAGVYLSSYPTDSSGNVTILGECSFSGVGLVSIAGIVLQTNNNYSLSVTGSSSSVVELIGCFFNASNHTPIQYSSSSASSAISLFQGQINLGTTGIAVHSHTGANGINYLNTVITNSGGSTTPANNSSGGVSIQNVSTSAPFSTSSSGQIGVYNSTFTIDQSSVSLVINGTSLPSFSYNSSYITDQLIGNISVGAGATLNITNANLTSGTAAITGTGTVNFSDLNTVGGNGPIFGSGLTLNGGIAPGMTIQAPSAGYVGEQIRSYNGSGQALSSATASNITSISVTPGVWDISAVSYIVFSVTSTSTALGISTTSATQPVAGGDDLVMFNLTHSLISPSIASYRQVVTTTTTYYLVATGTFVSGTGTAYGRISATRVG